MELYKKVLVGGCFDVFHYGHLSFLKEASKLGNYLVIMLEPDDKIRHYKKREPIHNMKHRAELLESLKFVDEVIQLDYLTSYEDYLNVIINVHPSVIALTDGDPQIHNIKLQAQIVDAEVITVVPLICNLSSTNIINMLSKI